MVNKVINLKSWVGENNTLETRIFSWELPFEQNTDTTLYDFDLDIDSVDTFQSVNFVRHTKDTVLHYQDGSFIKGYEVEVPRRQKDGPLTFYWRVRINGGGYLSEFTDVQNFTIAQYYGQQITDEMHNNLADDNAYMKDSNSSNVYQILNLYGQQLDAVKIENIRTKEDLYIANVRDSAVYNNFGFFVGLSKSASETSSEYRTKVVEVLNSFLDFAGRTQGILNIGKAFTGYEPSIVEYINTTFWKIYSSAETHTDHWYIKDPNYPQLTPIKLLSSKEKAFGWELYVYNPYQLEVDKVALKNLILNIKPIWTKVIILLISPYFGDSGYFGGISYWGQGFTEVL